MFAFGQQHIQFEGRLDSFSNYHSVDYHDVLVFKYRQRFGKWSSDVRYYNARGIVFVAIEWIHYRDDGSEVVKTRVDATVEFIKSWRKKQV